VFLAGRGKTGPPLRIRRKERKRRDIEKAWPALPESSRNLRDTEILKRERAGEGIVKMDGGIDFFSELF
jgi:hypothetical protein